MSERFLLTAKSSNRKVGKGTPVSMSHKGTCPATCKLRAGCYAGCGRLGLIWDKLSTGRLTNDVPWSDFLRQIRALGRHVDIWRHNQAGDLPGRNNRLHKRKCLELVRANAAGGRNRGGYTYTHYPVLATAEVPRKTLDHNAAVIREMNALGFRVNVSANNVTEADQIVALGIGPVAVTLPAAYTDRRSAQTPAGQRVVVCPALQDHKTTCVTCRLCQKIKRPMIGLPAHGTNYKQADAIAKEGQP